MEASGRSKPEDSFRDGHPAAEVLLVCTDCTAKAGICHLFRQKPDKKRKPPPDPGRRPDAFGARDFLPEHHPVIVKGPVLAAGVQLQEILHGSAGALFSGEIQQDLSLIVGDRDMGKSHSK